MSSTTTTSFNVKSLFGLSPQAELLLGYLGNLSVSSESTNPEVKSYSDAVYFNYYSLGLSLLFKPVKGYKPKMGLSRTALEDDKLVLDGVDLYNVPPSDSNPSTPARKTAEVAFSSYPVSPIVLKVDAEIKDKNGTPISRPEELSVRLDSSGKDFVESLGEPDRKGGGSGPSSGSIGIWCEWSKDGILVEFGGSEARGPQAWERGKDAVWRVISLFPPKET